MAQKFERLSLYEEVWREPISRLAKKYALSDNGLRKICITLKIPLPERGHWARIAAGQEIPTPPLPAGEAQSSYVSVGSLQAPSQPNDEDELWLRERAAFESNATNQIAVDMCPQRWHPLIRALRTRIEAKVMKLDRSKRAEDRSELRRKGGSAPSANFDAWEWRSFVHSGQLLEDGRRACAFRASISNRERALAIANTFFLEAEARGYSLSHSEREGRYKIEGHEGSVDFRISEKLLTKTKKARRYGGRLEDEKYREPSGCLTFYLEVGYFSGSQFSDTTGSMLQDQLNRAFVALSKLVVRCRVRARKQELARIERQRHEEEMAERRRLEEDERQRVSAERARQRALYKESARWAKALEIRRYIEHVSLLAPDTASPNFTEWRSWATATAKTLDPTEPRVASFSVRNDTRPTRNSND
jgi:hypothetical protein